MSTLILGITLQDLAGAVLGLPLGAGVLCLCLLAYSKRGDTERILPLVKTLGLGAPLLSFIFILLMAYMMDGAPEGVVLGPLFDWLAVQHGSFDVAFWMDPLAFTYALLVSLLALLMVLYALGMKRSAESLVHCLGLSNLMLFALLLVIWSDSIPLLYIAWEVMAFCGYFMLRGSSHEAASDSAANTLFWSTRLANLSLLLGVLISFWWLVQEVPEVTQVRLTFALLEEYRDQLPPVIVTLWLFAACLYAAQFPLCFWLSRAAGRDWFSLAWLYGLGMVTAGLYLILRLNFLILTQEAAWLALEWVGAVTALLAAITALFQPTVRRILAYATMSQAGLVVCAIGSGAYYLGIFHAVISFQVIILLFCSAGLLNERIGTDELAQLGGTRRLVPLAFIGTLVGATSLIGLLPLAGFFSRYAVLWNLVTQDRLFAGTLLGLAGIASALYGGRLIAAVFLGPARGAELPGQGRNPLAMTVPVLVMIALVLAGIWYGRPESFFGTDRLRTWLMPVFEDYLPIRSEIYGPVTQRLFGLLWAGFILLLTVATCLLYAYKAHWLHRPRRMLRGLAHCAERDGYSFEILMAVCVRPIISFARSFVGQVLESKLVDGLILGGVASSFQMAGRGLARLHSGRVQHYLLWFLVGVAALVLWVTR